jgi:hypothetical protein
MADQTSILRALAAAKEPMTIDAICALVMPGEDCRPRTPKRKNVVECLGRLAINGYAERGRIYHAPKSLTYAGSDKAGSSSFWEATAAGRKLIAGGGVVSRARPGPRTSGIRQTSPIKQLLWTALRHKGKATLGDLAELVHRPGGPDSVNVIATARHFMQRLCRAGITVAMQKRVPSALSARGAIRYALVRDLGPLAPVCCKRDLFDPNNQTRIPYREAADA